jgi:tight adherence protein C
VSVELIAIFAFLTVLSVGYSVTSLVFGGKNAIGDRLSERLKTIESGSLAERQKITVKDTTSDVPKGFKAIKEKLLHAGLRRQSDFEKFVLFQRICYTIPLFAMAGLVFLFHLPFLTASLFGVAVGIVCVVVPRFWLIKAIAKRRKEIRRHLPDTLDLFVIALQAGLSFDSALVRVGEEQRRISTHISREFLFTNQQILVGKSREEALRVMAERIGLEEVDGLVRAVIQSNRLGTSLIKTLQIQGETLRKKRRQEIQAQILKAPIKLIFPLMLCILPTLGIVIMIPAGVQFLRQLGSVTGSGS